MLRRRFSTALLFFLLAGLFPQIGLAQSCAEFFSTLALKDFDALSRNLDESLRKLSPEQAREIKTTVDALYFVDYKDSGPRLLDVFLGNSTLDQTGIKFRYDDGQGEVGRTFRNFTNARATLRASREKELSLETLAQAHREAMKDGVAGIAPERIGVVRDVPVIGVARSVGLTDEELASIKANPYLGFYETRFYDEAHQHYGDILYPTPRNAKPETLGRLESVDPKLAQEARSLQAKKVEASPETTRRFVTALINERLRWFEQERKKIGKIDTPEKLKAYISLTADFQRDLISIHPFADGNGRLTRAVLYELLEREDIPPPRFLSPNDDIQTSPEEWREQIFSGIVATQRLEEDLTQRALNGLPLESSPELVSPIIPRTVDLGFKKQGTKVVVADQRHAQVDSAQFGAWLKQKIRTDSLVLKNINSKPITTMQKFSDEFLDFTKKTRLDFDHKKLGVKEISLNFVDDDFVTVFANHSYRDPRSWQRKIERWYEAEQTVWRGLAYKQREVSEEEILGIFSELHPQMVSNESAKHSRRPGELLESVKNDFDRYNEDLYNETLHQMAKDHSETGPMYGGSYGYSTSKRREVGKAFAMGAMVVSKYGEQKKFQHLLKSRILIGAYKGKKDVDLARFYHLDSRFKYAYPRQSEVMGIGAADPDSVMVVQTINAKGEVDLTYARNPERPNSIWVIQGEYEPKPGVAPDPASLVKEVQLP